MTTQQLDQIAALRHENYSYQFIADKLSMSMNTVKSVCRRKGFDASGNRKTKQEKENATLCRYCLKPLPANSRKSAEFCSDLCRTKWWRTSRKIIKK